MWRATSPFVVWRRWLRYLVTTSMKVRTLAAILCLRITQYKIHPTSPQQNSIVAVLFLSLLIPNVLHMSKEQFWKQHSLSHFELVSTLSFIFLTIISMANFSIFIHACNGRPFAVVVPDVSPVERSYKPYVLCHFPKERSGADFNGDAALSVGTARKCDETSHLAHAHVEGKYLRGNDSTVAFFRCCDWISGGSTVLGRQRRESDRSMPKSLTLYAFYSARGHSFQAQFCLSLRTLLCAKWSLIILSLGLHLSAFFLTTLPVLLCRIHCNQTFLAHSQEWTLQIYKNEVCLLSIFRESTNSSTTSYCLGHAPSHCSTFSVTSSHGHVTSRAVCIK